MNSLSLEECWLITDTQDVAQGSSRSKHVGHEDVSSGTPWPGIRGEKMQDYHDRLLRSDTACKWGKTETWREVFSGHLPPQSTCGLVTGQSGPVPMPLPRSSGETMLRLPVSSGWDFTFMWRLGNPHPSNPSGHQVGTHRPPAPSQTPMMPEPARHGFCGNINSEAGTRGASFKCYWRRKSRGRSVPSFRSQTRHFLPLCLTPCPGNCEGALLTSFSLKYHLLWGSRFMTKRGSAWAQSRGQQGNRNCFFLMTALTDWLSQTQNPPTSKLSVSWNN